MTATSLNVIEIHQPQQWHDTLLRLPDPHVLQTWEWGEFKSRYGWQPRRLAFERDGQVRAAASVLRRRFGPLSILYVPKGPVLDYDNISLARQVLGHLEQLARRSRALLVKIDPDVILYKHPAQLDAADLQSPISDLRSPISGLLLARGWQYSAEQVQFRNTVVLSLAGSEDDWLARMKSKTRYNIRLAQRKGVTVRPVGADHLELLYQMYAETATRDGFLIRPLAYYRDAWGSFLQAGLARALLAEYEGQPLAGLILFLFGRRAWYFYGMSRDVYRNLMPTYLLQWEAMRLARQAGCEEYDLWGAPEVLDESDPLWGVYRFKQGLGGEYVRHLGAYDFPTSQPLYWAYSVALPKYLNLLRRAYRRRLTAPLQ